MGAYDNPDVNVGIDRQSGRMIGQAIAGIGQQIGGAVSQRAEKIAAAEKELAERKRKEAEQARIKAEQNWRIHKEVESQKTQAVINCGILSFEYMTGFTNPKFGQACKVKQRSASISACPDCPQTVLHLS